MPLSLFEYGRGRGAFGSSRKQQPVRDKFSREKVIILRDVNHFLFLFFNNILVRICHAFDLFF